jgi:hypothetical protein
MTICPVCGLELETGTIAQAVGYHSFCLELAVGTAKIELDHCHIRYSLRHTTYWRRKIERAQATYDMLASLWALMLKEGN